MQIDIYSFFYVLCSEDDPSKKAACQLDPPFPPTPFPHRPKSKVRALESKTD